MQVSRGHFSLNIRILTGEYFYFFQGGLGSDKEMCLNFMLYYPSMTVVTCESDEATIQPFFTAKFATLVYADLYV